MSGKKWVLLVAGSKDWENYSHQANVCTFYHIIKRQNLPDEQIVTMIYDDIASNPKNPKQGQIVSILDNRNVYEGMLKDYTGTEVTPENFLDALQGKVNGKKVIQSGKDDNIYIYMSGLGHPGTFEFPEKSLQANEFNQVIEDMTKMEKFSKMVIFMSSSYSGQMFKDQLQKNDKVFVLTSCREYTANTPTHYNQELELQLSDKFSSTWLDFINKVDFTEQTFHDLVTKKQSRFLKETSITCPCCFGHLDIKKLFLCEFLAE